MSDIFYNAQTNQLVANLSVLTCKSFKLVTSPSVDYVLTCTDLSGSGNWRSLSTLGVTSLQGTQHQVLVDGTFGTQEQGDLVLTLPQSIGTTSNVTFNALKLTNGASAGYVLISDPDGDASWTDTLSVPLLYAGVPASGNELVNKTYVDSTITGLTLKETCYASSTANLSATYSNGASGVGATLTSTANEVFSVDGQSPAVGKRVLINAQTTQLQNGIYSVTNAGSVGTPWILTRTGDYDTILEMDDGSTTMIENGTANGGTMWIQSGPVATIGTDPIAWIKTNPLNSITAGNGITKTSTTISADINTTNLQFTSAKINTIQDISTASSPQFAALRLTTGASNGYILKSDASGNTSWVDPSVVSTETLTGTANQVLVNGTSGSPQTGNLTLTLPQDIATSSTVQFGKLGIGAALADGLLDVQGSLSTATYTYGQLIRPALTTTGANRDCFCLYVGGTQTVNASGTNMVHGINIQLAPTATTTIDSVRGLWISPGSGSGTISKSYGLYIEQPTNGTVKMAAWLQNLNIGSSLTATSPQTNGLTVAGDTYLQGKLGLGVAPSSTITARIRSAATHSTALSFDGTVTTGSSNEMYGISYSATLAPSDSTATFVPFIINPTINLNTNNSSITGIWVQPFVGRGAFTTTDYFGVRSRTPSSSGAGAITSAYCGYFEQPSFATNNVGLYTASLSVGYTGTNVTENNAIIEGKLAVGITSPLAKLHVFDASSSPATDLGSIVLSGSVGTGGTPRLLTGLNYTGTSMAYSWIQSVESGVAARYLSLQPNSSAAGTGVVIGSVSSPSNLLAVSGTLSVGSGYVTSAAPTNGLLVEGRTLLGGHTGSPVNTCAIGGNLSVGGSYTGTSAPTDGLIVQGKCVIGGSAAPTYQLEVYGTVGSTGLVVVGNAEIGNGTFIAFNAGDQASATHLTVAGCNSFIITGTTTVQSIGITGQSSGFIFLVQFASAGCTLKNMGTTSGITKQIHLSGGVDFTSSANSILQFWYDGTRYWEIGSRITY